MHELSLTYRKEIKTLYLFTLKLPFMTEVYLICQINNTSEVSPRFKPPQLHIQKKRLKYQNFNYRDSEGESTTCLYARFCFCFTWRAACMRSESGQEKHIGIVSRGG